MWSNNERVREKDIKRYMEDLHKIAETMERGHSIMDTVDLHLTVTITEAYHLLNLLMQMRGLNKPAPTSRKSKSEHKEGE